MPLRVWVDVETRVRYAVASGVVTDAEILADYGGVVADAAYDPALDMVFDCSGIDQLAVGPMTLRRISELVARADRGIAPGVHPRAAIVAPGDVAFGMARMYEAYREQQESPRRYLVCRTMGEARAWLGLPATDPH